MARWGNWITKIFPTGQQSCKPGHLRPEQGTAGTRIKWPEPGLLHGNSNYHWKSMQRFLRLLASVVWVGGSNILRFTLLSYERVSRNAFLKLDGFQTAFRCFPTLFNHYIGRWRNWFFRRSPTRRGAPSYDTCYWLAAWQRITWLSRLTQMVYGAWRYSTGRNHQQSQWLVPNTGASKLVGILNKIVIKLSFSFSGSNLVVEIPIMRFCSFVFP